MSTPTFQTATAGTPPPDPHKHVNYTQGMILGVDDFTQEFAFHAHRDRWLARDAIGYGTLSGLRVGLETKDGEPEVSVEPGTALSPRGQLIRVEFKQCARLNAWLALDPTKAELSKLAVGADGAVTAFVMLSYRDSATDDVPIPGEPCRCEDDILASSRLRDDFQLELRLQAPAQAEEDALRAFVRWLRKIPLAATLVLDDVAAFLEAIRTAAREAAAATPPAYFPEAPPAGLQIPSTEATAWLRAAFLIWTTELRPRWQAGEIAPDDGVLLAALELKLTGGRVAAVSDLRLDERRRPFVLHLRMLQEWALSGVRAAQSGSPAPETLPLVGAEYSVVAAGHIAPSVGSPGTELEFAL